MIVAKRLNSDVFEGFYCVCVCVCVCVSQHLPPFNSPLIGYCKSLAEVLIRIRKCFFIFVLYKRGKHISVPHKSDESRNVTANGGFGLGLGGLGGAGGIQVRPLVLVHI